MGPLYARYCPPDHGQSCWAEVLVSGCTWTLLGLTSTVCVLSEARDSLAFASVFRGVSGSGWAKCMPTGGAVFWRSEQRLNMPALRSCRGRLSSLGVACSVASHSEYLGPKASCGSALPLH